MAEAFLKTSGGEPIALNLLLDGFSSTDEAILRGWDLPIAVICGTEDQDNGHAEALAEILPQGCYVPIPGNHMSAVTKPDLGVAMRDALCLPHCD